MDILENKTPPPKAASRTRISGKKSKSTPVIREVHKRVRIIPSKPADLISRSVPYKPADPDQSSTYLPE